MNYLNEIGNAKEVTKEQLTKTHLVMKRYESVFDFYAEEPASIIVREKSNDERECYSRFLMIRIWRSSGKCVSWSVFSKDREQLSSLIIRKVTWDMDLDMKFALENINKNRDMLLQRNPAIRILNKFITSAQAEAIIQQINSVDVDVENGFILREKKEPDWTWRDLEILRLYNWGQVHMTWSPIKCNESVMHKINCLLNILDKELESNDTSISSMTLMYDEMLDNSSAKLRI